MDAAESDSAPGVDPPLITLLPLADRAYESVSAPSSLLLELLLAVLRLLLLCCRYVSGGGEDWPGCGGCCGMSVGLAVAGCSGVCESMRQGE